MPAFYIKLLRMRHLLLLLGLGMACRTPAAGQTSFTLPNGLRGAVQQRKSAPLIAIDFWVLAGSREEREEEHGSAHFLEHTLFKGTTLRGAGGLDEDIEALGGVWGAATGPDYAHYFTAIPPQHLGEALQILADLIQNATLPQKEIERERGVILDELAERLADPQEVLRTALYRVAFDRHPYRRPPGGSPSAIRQRDRDTLLRFYKRNYAPDRCVVVLAGALSEDVGKEAIGKAFGAWKRSNNPAQGVATEAESAEPRVQEILLHRPSSVPRFSMAFHAPAAQDFVLSAAGRVMAEVLGEKGVGRLGSSEFASAEMETRYNPRHDRSLFAISAVARTPLPLMWASELSEKTQSVLNTLRETLVPSTELAFAKQRAIGRLRFDMETTTGLARTLGYAAITLGEPPAALIARMERLTADELLRFAQRVFDPQRRILVYAPGASPPQPRSEMGSMGVTKQASRCATQGRFARKPFCKQPPNITNELARYSLPCGARLVFSPDGETETMLVTLFVALPPPRTPQEAATSEIVARALFYGSLNRSYESVARAVGRAGGNLATRYTPYYAAFSCVASAERLTEISYLLCEALKNAEFSPGALERARKEILAERDNRLKTPFEAAREAVVSRLSATPSPMPEAYRRVTSEQALAYFRATYTPQSVVISVGGKFDPRRAFRTFDNNLFDFERKSDTNRRKTPLPERVIESVALRFSSENGVAYAMVGTPAPNVVDGDFPAFYVLQTLLGVGHASRLFRALREERGIGYAVGVSYDIAYMEPLLAQVQWDAQRLEPNQSVEAILEALNAVVASLSEKAFLDKELIRARNVAITRHALARERAQERAFFRGWCEVLGLGYDYDAELPKRFAGVTREDLVRVVQKYLKVRVSAVVTPPNPVKN